MSRSRRHHPILPVTTAASDKRDKVRAHRAERVVVRGALAAQAEAPDAKLFGDPWKASKDGKIFHADAAPALLRK